MQYVIYLMGINNNFYEQTPILVPQCIIKTIHDSTCETMFDDMILDEDAWREYVPQHHIDLTLDTLHLDRVDVTTYHQNHAAVN